MTFKQLEYIVALDDYRHYVIAAEHCFISQPNLTMQVKKLEEEIGVRIFDRDKKPLQPTDIGKQVILRARQILRECRQLKEFVNHEKEAIEGEFTIGIIPTLAPYLLPLFLPIFMDEYPRVHLKIQELQTTQIIASIENGIIDLGLLVTPINKTPIREIPVFYEPFLLYLPKNHALLKKKYIRAENLEAHEVLVLEEGHCFRDQALSICKFAKNASAKPFDYQSGSIEAMKNLVHNGLGYTLVPELSILHDHNALHVRRFYRPEPVREVSIVVHNNFIKESVIASLKNMIQRVVPAKFLQAQAKIDLQWN